MTMKITEYRTCIRDTPRPVYASYIFHVRQSGGGIPSLGDREKIQSYPTFPTLGTPTHKNRRPSVGDRVENLFQRSQKS